MGARTCAIETALPRGGGPTGGSPIFVQAGTKIDMNFGVMQRDPDFWGPDAEEFRPERWQTVRPKWEYIPFLVSGLLFPKSLICYRSLGSRTSSIGSKPSSALLLFFQSITLPFEGPKRGILTRISWQGGGEDMSRAADGAEPDGLCVGDFCNEV